MQSATKRHLEIPKELKVFDILIYEYQGRLAVKGKYINQSVYVIKGPLGAFTIGEAGNEIVFFPSLNIEKSNQPRNIEPFEEGEFCHYLSEEEASSIKESRSVPIELKFLEFDKSRKKD